MTMTIVLPDEKSTISLGEELGRYSSGGFIIELVGDIGAGKTTLVKGLARGLGVRETIQSPSYTISFCYPARNNLSLHHYDFYRLQEPELVAHELHEAIHDTEAVVVIEWADTVASLLPRDRTTTIRFTSTPLGRKVTITGLLASFLKKEEV